MIIATIALLSVQPAAPSFVIVPQVAVEESTPRHLSPFGLDGDASERRKNDGPLSSSVIESVVQVSSDTQFLQMDADGNGLVDPSEHAIWRQQMMDEDWSRIAGYTKSDRGAPCSALQAISGPAPR